MITMCILLVLANIYASVMTGNFLFFIFSVLCGVFAMLREQSLADRIEKLEKWKEGEQK